jgi:glycosyltransferase involved in cell wall biosynthesis
MVPYKCMDIVVSAFADMPGRKLVVIGDGPEKARVTAAARGGENISFVGAVSTTELVRFMQRARAFVFAAEEDFGIMMVEAQACGTPVIAYGRGGALDILAHDPPTGLFFDAQTPQAIAAAVQRFDAMTVTPEVCRENSLRFGTEKFRAGMQAVIDSAMAQRN